MTDWSKVPAREWEWREGNATCGVHTREGKLVWWSRPDGYSGYMFEAGRDQWFADFLASGPSVGAPAHVVDELGLFLVEHGVFRMN